MLHHAAHDVGFVEREALVFPEVAVNDALADGLLEDGGGVEAVGREGGGGAALVEEALFVGAVVAGHGCGGRGGDGRLGRGEYDGGVARGFVGGGEAMWVRRGIFRGVLV